MSALGILGLAAVVVITCGILAQVVRVSRRDRQQRAGLLTQAELMKSPVHPAYQERHAADIWASRLVTLCVRSGTVFPHPEGKTPVEGLWLGTSEELHEALLCSASRLHQGERWEVPAVAALEARMASMLHHSGRLRVERAAIPDYQRRCDVRGWRLTLSR